MKSAQRLANLTRLLIVVLICLTCFAVLLPVHAQDSISSNINSVIPVDNNLIVVGLRTDARPFSYRKKTAPNEAILPGFGGYMVEVCRHVLRKLVAGEVFQGYSIVAKIIEAKDRFAALESGSVNMLCGPDSITPGRLNSFYVSHPLFLSGMTYGYVNPASEKFPESAYCKNVVGVVRGTTAESVGLGQLDQNNLLLRFDEALELDRGKNDDRLKEGEEAIKIAARSSGCFDENWLKAASSGMVERAINTQISKDRQQAIWREHGRSFGDINGRLAAGIITSECPAGFTGLPVRRYNNHDDGIEAFCKGEVLYYLGDYDIVKSKIPEFSQCDVVMSRFTSSREMYGAFFYRPTDQNHHGNGIKNEECLQEKHLGISVASPTDKAGLLYSEFNKILLQEMQGKTGILEQKFIEQFGESAKSKDLAGFFDGFKITSHD